MVTIVCVIGTFAVFDENPMNKLKYIFSIVLIATPVNILMLYLTCRAK